VRRLQTIAGNKHVYEGRRKGVSVQRGPEEKEVQQLEVNTRRIKTGGEGL